MTDEQSSRYKRICKWILVVGYPLFLAPTYVRSVRTEGFTDGTSLFVLMVIILPYIIYALAYIIRAVAKKRIEIDLASDHDRNPSLFSGITVKYILIGIGIVVLLLFVILVPAPWNIFLLLGGTYAVFTSLRYVS